MIETAILSALAPAAVDAIKNLFNAGTQKWIGLSVDDQIKLQNAEVAKVQALSALDNPYGTPSQWVVDLRGSFRYIACGVFVLAGISTMFFAPQFANIGLEAAMSASSFIFGERMLLSIKGSNK